MKFICSMDPQGLRLNISKHEGSFVPWWKDIRIEVYGWKPAHGSVQQDGREGSIVIHPDETYFDFTVPDTGQGTLLNLQ